MNSGSGQIWCNLHPGETVYIIPDSPGVFYNITMFTLRMAHI